MGRCCSPSFDRELVVADQGAKGDASRSSFKLRFPLIVQIRGVVGTASNGANRKLAAAAPAHRAARGLVEVEVVAMGFVIIGREHGRE